jgi:hypothetical protein
MRRFFEGLALAFLFLFGGCAPRVALPTPATITGDVLGESGLHLYARILTRACWGIEDEDVIGRTMAAIVTCQRETGGPGCEARICEIMLHGPKPEKLCKPEFQASR